jgi:hypothetical protein
MMTRVLIVWLCLTANAWAQRLIHVTDPAGHGIEVATAAIVKLRPHQGGCIIYLVNTAQHVREDCLTVLRLIADK